MNDLRPDRRSLRCSDEDREKVAELLRDAAADGRLGLGELEERLEAAFSAKTYGDLEPLTADLRPVTRDPAPRTATPSAPTPGTGSQRIVSILGNERRQGRWDVPPRIEVTCLLGDVTLDFTEAVVRHRNVVVEAGVVLGTLKVVVPDGADVRLEPGATILGERKSRLRTPTTVGGPVIQIRGFVLLGEIIVRPPRQLLWR